MVAPLVVPGARAAQPRRVVALTPAFAEMALEILPVDRQKDLVGVSDFSHAPSGSGAVVVASATHLNLDRLLLLNPDLVLAARGTPAARKLVDSEALLRARRITLSEIAIEGLGSIPAAYRRLGELLGEPRRGEALALEFERGLAELQGKSRSLGSVFFQIDAAPLMAVAGGRDFLVELLARLGFESIFSGLPQSYVNVSEESVVRRDPDWIVVLGLAAERAKFQKMADHWRERYPRLKAVIANRVRVVDADLLTMPSLSALRGARALSESLARK